MSLQLAEASLELPSPHNATGMRRASMWLKDYVEDSDIPAEQFDRLDLFLNEALANVLDHGGPAALASPIKLNFNLNQALGVKVATLTIIDSGKAFDPLSFTPRAKPQTLDEAIPGGLGIQMMRNLADDLRYHYQDGHNHLTFTIRWKTAVSPTAVDSVQVQRFGHDWSRRQKELEVSDEKRVAQYERRTRGLSWLPLFRDTDEAAVHETIKDSDVLLLPAGTPLLKPGDANDSVFILLTGNLAAYLDSDLNPNASIPITPGECIGELSAIDGKPVTALVVATEEARVLKLTPDQFLNKLMTIPGVARNLLVSLTERMRRTNDSMLESQRKQLDLEHLRKELEVARQLQASMLPLRHPMFPGRNDIEVSALMEPTSEVGGDLFDAFFVDTRHLFICIGDVSGHGIPAALFMARAIGLMRIVAMGTLDPGCLIERINEQLCTGNDTNLFVTLFCGFLDVTTGHLVYSNGGHCAPIVLSHGKASRLPIPKGTLVGAIPDLTYVSSEIVLAPGETLVCFTDGITEAQPASGEEFSEERLVEVLQNTSDKSLENIQEAIRSAVTDFTGSNVLDDDYTLLMVRRLAK